MQDATPEWLTTIIEYEGFPLALRVRPKIDQPIYAEQFPHLGIVSHTLTHVLPDGRPEPSYNATLADLDAAVHDTLENGGGGLIMIVETFGGKRNYYACLSDMDAHRAWISGLKAAYLQHELEGDFRSHRAQSFYRQYRNDFHW